MPELSITDSQPLPPAGALSIAKSESLPGDLGPSPAMAEIGNTIFKDLSAAPRHIMDSLSGHPLDDVKQAIADSTAARQPYKQKALEAYKAGDYKAAAENAFFGLIPFIGPALGGAADEYQGGDKSKAIAHAIEILGPALADPAMDLVGSDAVATAKAKIASAADTTATVVKGAAKGAGKGIIAPITLKKAGIELEVPGGQVAASAALGGQATSMMGIGHTPGAVVGAAAPIVKGALQGAREALAAKIAAAPETRAAVALKTYTDAQAAAHAQLLDDMSVAVTGDEKAKFAALTAEQQARAQELAQRTQRPNAVPVVTPAPVAARPSAPIIPAPEDVQAGKTIADIAREELTPKPAPAAAQGQESPSVAHQLFESMKESGEIPPEAKPGEPFGAEPKPVEAFKEAARGTRATNAETLADTFHQSGIPAADALNVTAEQWKAVAHAIGVDFPETKAAQTSLIREAMKALRLKEDEVSSASQMMQKVGN